MAKPPLYVWTSRSLGDQLLIARLLSLMSAQQIDADCVQVLQFLQTLSGQAILSMGELSPRAIVESMPEPVRLSESDASSYRAAWLAYTSADPEDLIKFMRAPGRPAVLFAAMQRLAYRYPDSHSGLSFVDRSLLESCVCNGPRASRVVGALMGHDQTPDRLGDAYLFWRLLQMGSSGLNSPLISATGDCREMRTCEVVITDSGRQVLQGEANAVDVNGSAGWVGGVNLSVVGRPVCQLGDQLRRF